MSRKQTPLRPYFEKMPEIGKEKVIREFYVRDAAGIPRDWVARMRASMMHLARHFSTNHTLKR